MKDRGLADLWRDQAEDVYLVIRQKDATNAQGAIRWMNVTRILKNRKETETLEITFEGEKLNAQALWKARDRFFRNR